ncbi:hypothetical protein LNKW23_27980 [Paralimibaculum aggregatum]|uniref:Yip1 domain-containing protein n=1 Tax=Paralimibaculum aggregatum TaxID=3036245 RepID=A0ABQ6LMQ3_9RHOB|nr:YIP1 family protein [Limibaculum sp. NKW23]GMG83585.1 hypothetical protein LNKW23_27980 [Limibaculum sp. NKW23]
MATEGMAREGMTIRVLGAWRDMRGTMRAVLDGRPSETALLVFILVSGLLHFLGSMAEFWLDPRSIGLEQGEALANIYWLGIFFFVVRTIGLYMLALLGHLLARAFGGRGDAYASRAAMAWAALVAAPVWLMLKFLGLSLQGEIGHEPARAIGEFGYIPFIYALAHCFAEAHGFQRTWAVLGVIALLVMMLFSGLMLLSSS